MILPQTSKGSNTTLAYMFQVEKNVGWNQMQEQKNG